MENFSTKSIDKMLGIMGESGKIKHLRESFNSLESESVRNSINSIEKQARLSITKVTGIFYFHCIIQNFINL